MSFLLPKNFDLLSAHDECGVGFIARISGKADHDILTLGIQSVVRLTHRGALGSDANTGDGAGVLTQIPYKLLQKDLAKLGKSLSAQDLAVGMVFLPLKDTKAQSLAKKILEEALKINGVRVLGWRQVPANPSKIGKLAADTRPQIEQIFLARPSGINDQDFERLLYLSRRQAENRVLQEKISSFYIPSLSCKTIVYKGLLIATQLMDFYPDLANPDYETALTVFHQRYSTNTLPEWSLAQPFHYLAHNGEINTLKGNRNWMKAREPELSSPLWKEKIQDLKPLIDEKGSDSASLDNMLEFLTLSGRDLLHSQMMLVPEAWQNMPLMDATQKAFYQYHACLMEPWDGPAALAFTDGNIVGAALDRNGLRPARYVVTKDGIILMCSEVGVVEFDETSIERKGRLGPGKMIAVDISKGVLLEDEAIKKSYVNRKPYGQWIHHHTMTLNQEIKFKKLPKALWEEKDLIRHQKFFNYTKEEIDFNIKPMIEKGKEPVFSMGDDTPLAVLSDKPRLLYAYFKQLFAQVTNPPIDHIREELVFSLNTILGQRPNILEELPEHAKLVLLTSPVLMESDLEALKKLTEPAFKTKTLSCSFARADGPAGLEKALEVLCRQASQAVDEGTTILILSDRSISGTQVPVPMLLVTGAIHHHLIREGKRMRASLVCDTGEAHDTHQIALLLGYGASAVCPYLLWQTTVHIVEKGEIKDLDLQNACQNYRASIDTGIFKIMSKMGISALGSYRGAQIFEALGLSEKIIDRCFAGTPSRIGGMDFEELTQELLKRHDLSFGSTNGLAPSLDQGGYYRFRVGEEYHGFNPNVVKALHAAVRHNNWEAYKKYAELVNNHTPVAIRDLLELQTDRNPIPLEEVEPIEKIRSRFTTASMSYGALSKEAHETLAIAMNRIGGKSGSGEGGEDARRFKPLPNGDLAVSRIKQVASGRFGVTPEYLINCDELEIKMAQGSKPGEGGQLPGHKVSVEIAALRHSVPGVTLISPPPHHDIYSIEDLAQLIYDLKQINPKAKVCVKLVSEAGVGTIAAGVAKGHADVILVSGCEGGTGASPLSSIKNAGVPWELGISETQQVLMVNNLRGRIILRTDGGMKSGLDIVKATLLGAESYNFGTAALVAEGCVMARQCHLNTCPVGVTTHKPELRAKYTGTPEMVVNFFNFVSQEIREILASLGYKSMDEIVGRVDLLKMKLPQESLPKMKNLDLSFVTHDVDPSRQAPRLHTQERNDWEGDKPLDDTIIRDAALALDGKGQVKLSYNVQNVNRTIGARLSGEVAKRYGNVGLPSGTIQLHLIGSAGQSLGAFLANGIRIILSGEANDYVGKGLGGGEIILKPNPQSTFDAKDNVIMGNTCLYGATGGSLFAAGRAGERFCVRNSGARAVVEGVGDHGCEYMTGGVAVILGKTGKNFGAGMTGGLAFVLDTENNFKNLYNPELVLVDPLTYEEDIQLLQDLINQHWEYTQSPWAQEILSHWDDFLPLFFKVHPRTSPAKTEAVMTAKE